MLADFMVSRGGRECTCWTIATAVVEQCRSHCQYREALSSIWNEMLASQCAEIGVLEPFLAHPTLQTRSLMTQLRNDARAQRTSCDAATIWAGAFTARSNSVKSPEVRRS